MELKLFIAENPRMAEAEVNEWLKSSSARVDHVSQSQSEKNGRFVFVISIYYRVAAKQVRLSASRPGFSVTESQREKL
ncbi:MAG TPA: hypothetical protein VF145_01060 [Chitinophagaceae bacterium]